MNENKDRSIFIKCECQGEGMGIDYDVEDRLYYFSYWSSGLSNRPLSWRDRIRYCWEVLSKGKAFNDELVFGEKSVDKIIDFLLGYKRLPKKKMEKLIEVIEDKLKKKK